MPPVQGFYAPCSGVLCPRAGVLCPLNQGFYAPCKGQFGVILGSFNRHAASCEVGKRR